jgi:hypothetical protein
MRMLSGKAVDVSGDVLMALAQFAGQTVVAAAITDGWESARKRFARLLGRDDAKKTQLAERWLSQTREQLIVTGEDGLESARRVHADRWADRFADLLYEDPSIEGRLRALAEEVATELPTAAASAGDHSVAAGRNVDITASSGGIAAGVIHGNLIPPGPTTPGPAME